MYLVRNLLTGNHRLSNNTSEPARMRKTEPSESTTEHQSTGSSNQRSSSECRSEPRYSFKIGIYGWRKRCLYFLILGLLVMVIVNLALTLWVLKVMEFSSEGMGQLRIVSGGLQLNGRAMVLDALIASSIRSRAGQPIVIESSRNLTLSTRNERGALDNRIFLGHDRFECLANNFMVTDDRGRVLFSANRREVVVGAEELRVSGEGGVVFDGSVQTPLVRADPGRDLRLESLTRSLDLRAPVSINIESRAGDIKATSLKDIKLQSVAGEIRLDAASVMMPSIPTALPTSRSTSTLSGSARTHDVYQLCVCANGKLFLAPSHGVCAVEEDSRVCR